MYQKLSSSRRDDLMKKTFLSLFSYAKKCLSFRCEKQWKIHFLTCNILKMRIRNIYRYTDAYNVHMHRNPKTLETLMTLSSSDTKLLLPSWFLGFQREERETHTHTIFTMLTVPSDPNNAQCIS